MTGFQENPWQSLEAELGEPIFPLCSDEQYLVNKLIESMETLIRRSSSNEGDIALLAKLKHGLRRLPLTTPGLGIELSLKEDSTSRSWESMDVSLNDGLLEIGLTTCYYEPKVGSDHDCRSILTAETGGYRSPAHCVATDPQTLDWLDRWQHQASSTAYAVNISEEAGETDWELQPGTDLWDRLP